MMTNRPGYIRSEVKSSKVWNCSESEGLGFNLCVVPSLNVVSLISEIRDWRVGVDLVGEDTSQTRMTREVPSHRARKDFSDWGSERTMLKISQDLNYRNIQELYCKYANYLRSILVKLRTIVVLWQFTVQNSTNVYSCAVVCTVLSTVQYCYTPSHLLNFGWALDPACSLPRSSSPARFSPLSL